MTQTMTWKLINARIRKAEETGEEYASLQGISEPPVDPFELAESESPLLKVLTGDFQDAFDGQLECHGARKRFLLFLNTKYDMTLRAGKHHPRTRFSLAHELAHYFLESHRAFLMGGGTAHGSRSEYRSEPIVEREADAFASGLLMPRHLIRRFVNQDELSFERIGDLAKHFETSVVSTAIRSVHVSHFPCAIAGIREGSVKWCFLSESLIDAGCYPGDREILSSSTARTRWEEFRLGTFTQCESDGHIGEWFCTYDKEHLNRIYLSEEYLAVPVMETLLVLLTIAEDDLFEEED